MRSHLNVRSLAWRSTNIGSLKAALAWAIVLAAGAPAALSAPPCSDYAVAWRQAQATGRPLVVLVGAAWCGPCRVMKTAVLPTVAEAGGLEGVEFAYVDVDLDPELARCLIGRGAIPQLIRYTKDPNGWVREVVVGVQSQAQVTSFVQGRRPAVLEVAVEAVVAAPGSHRAK